LKTKKYNGVESDQELLMVEFVEYISDGDEEGFPWLH
jgi:hypothetical protein